MLESSRCSIIIRSDDHDGIYGMVEKCWLELIPNMPPKPTRINMAVGIIVKENPFIMRPENIRVGDRLKFFYPCSRCFNWILDKELWKHNSLVLLCMQSFIWFKFEYKDFTRGCRILAKQNSECCRLVTLQLHVQTRTRKKERYNV